MRVLVLGFGSMGQRHAANLAALGHEIGVQDSDRDRNQQAAAAGYVMPDKVWLADISAVVIATPADQHAAQIATWRETPMLIEKPLALRTSDLSVRPLEAWVGYNWRYHPQVLALRAAIAGNDVCVHFSCFTNINTWPGRRYAHPILECSHELDLVRWWRGGKDSDIWAIRRGESYCIFEFMSGDAIGLIWNSPVAVRSIALVASCARETLRLSIGEELQQSYRAETEAFMDWVGRDCNGPPGCSFDDGLAALRLCEQALATGEVARES